LLGKDRKGTIVNVTSAGAHMIIPTMSSYNLSKLAITQFTAYVSAENPNVNAVALHPGIFKTDMTLEMFMRFANDKPELVGGVAVWLATEKAEFLKGKYIESYWSVDDLVARKEEIVAEGKLSLVLKGDFGKKFFE